MKKCLIVLFVLALVFASSYASAEGTYAKGSIGAFSLSDSTLTVVDVGSAELEFDMGLHLGGAVGTDLGNNTRVELEIAYSTTYLDRVTGAGGAIAVAGDVNVLSLLLSWYYDYKSNSPIAPFIGGGIGVANVELDSGDSDNDTVFAYQVGAGLGYAVNDRMTFELGYKYIGVSDPEFQSGGSTVEAEVDSYNFYLGVRVPI